MKAAILNLICKMAFFMSILVVCWEYTPIYHVLVYEYQIMKTLPETVPETALVSLTIIFHLDMMNCICLMCKKNTLQRLNSADHILHR